MEPRNEYYDGDDYIKTTTANIVSRKAIIQKPQKVEMKGKCIIKPNCVLWGDLAPIRVGRYCNFDEGTTLKPGSTKQNGEETYLTLTIGNMTMVGRNCSVSAACIGSNVFIGENCVISDRCILKDCCMIKNDSVLPPGMVVPPFAIVSGKPARIIGELPPSASIIFKERAHSLYKSFKKKE